MSANQTVSGVGAAQGVAVLDDVVYVYGDAETGVIRPLSLAESGLLVAAAPDLALTVDGVDRVPHPTGLAFDSVQGVFVGNTVSGRGEMLQIDWPALASSRTLDGAIVSRIDDTAAANGSRPRYVQFDGRSLIASADYGNQENRVRLYDPAALATAPDTAQPGVVIAQFTCGPFVQSLAYWRARDILVLVQNTHSGAGWRLTLVQLAASVQAGAAQVVDVFEPALAGELEGFDFLDDRRALMVTSAAAGNVYLGELEPIGDR